MWAVGTIMPIHSMRIIGKGAGYHNTDSIIWGWPGKCKSHWELGSVSLDLSYPPA